MFHDATSYELEITMKDYIQRHNYHLAHKINDRGQKEERMLFLN